MLRLQFFAGLVLGAAAAFLPSCASTAGQLAAEELAPLVESVTGDLEAYLDAGIAPDGSQLSPARTLQQRGGVVILRNAIAVARGLAPEPLPTLDPPGGADAR